MISQDLLDILRCPLDPSNAQLRPHQDHLECDRCALKFNIKDGFPVLVVEEAELPPGCAKARPIAVPCQRAPRRASRRSESSGDENLYSLRPESNYTSPKRKRGKPHSSLALRAGVHVPTLQA